MPQAILKLAQVTTRCSVKINARKRANSNNYLIDEKEFIKFHLLS